MKEVPVKVEKDGKWVVSRIGLGEDRIRLAEPFNREILLKSIVDVEERKNVLILTTKGEPAEVLKIASVEQVLQVLKKLLIMNCSAYRLMAYFMSPAVRGGVLITSAQWEKGAIAVVKSGIWFVSQNKQVCVPMREVAAIELTKKDVNLRQVDVVKIDHLENKEVVTSFLLCPISTLQNLLNFLKDTTKDMDMKGTELDPVAAQVAMLVYSGMDSKSIENMLNLPQKQLDAIFEKLLALGIAEVVCVRKEVQLTSKGVRYISDAVKTPTQ